MPISISEKDKYSKIWEFDSYRERSPGLDSLLALRNFGFDFMEKVLSENSKTFIDIGCGSGKLSDHLIREYGDKLEVFGFDIAENCLDQNSLPANKDNYLIVGDLTSPNLFSGERWDASFCCDVLEHIPTEHVPTTLKNIKDATNGLCFLGIALYPDSGGDLIGHPLHLTVKPKNWWKTEIEKAGFEIIWDRKVGIAEVDGNKERRSTTEKLTSAIKERRIGQVIRNRLANIINKIKGHTDNYFVVVRSRH